MQNAVKTLQDRDLLVKFPGELLQLADRTELHKEIKMQFSVYW